MTWFIVKRKTEEFKISRVAVAIAIAIITWVSTIFSSISSISLLLILLYYLHYDCKLFKITRSIIEQKTDEFKMSKVVIIVIVTVVAFVLSSFLQVLSFVYQFY